MITDLILCVSIFYTCLIYKTDFVQHRSFCVSPENTVIQDNELNESQAAWFLNIVKNDKDTKCRNLINKEVIKKGQ